MPNSINMSSIEFLGTEDAKANLREGEHENSMPNFHYVQRAAPNASVLHTLLYTLKFMLWSLYLHYY